MSANMIAIRGSVVTPVEVIKNGEVVIDKKRIVEIQRKAKSHLTGVQLYDIPGAIVVPGFIDIHTHGIGGFSTPGKIRQMAEWKKRYGTTGFLPTLACATHKSYLDFLREVKKTMQNPPPETSKVLGAHLEGPYINPAMKGGMDEKYLRVPEEKEYKELIQTGGDALKLMTLSPELPRAISLIKALHKNGTVVSLGHSMATLEQVDRAIEAGLTHVCHLYNAFPSIRKKKTKGNKTANTGGDMFKQRRVNC